MSRPLKIIWNTVTTLLVVVLALLAVLLAGVRLFGLQVFTVLSGSMEPVYHVGSVIYVKSVPAAELAEGDDLTFRLPDGTVVTHRIVRVEENGGARSFVTKGVANDTEDGAVPEANVIGKPVFTIPRLGYLANYIQRPPGSYIAIAAAALAVLLTFVPELWSRFAKKRARPAGE